MLCPILLQMELLYVFVCSLQFDILSRAGSCLLWQGQAGKEATFPKKARRPEHAIPLDSPGLPYRKRGRMNAMEFKITISAFL